MATLFGNFLSSHKLFCDHPKLTAISEFGDASKPCGEHQNRWQMGIPQGRYPQPWVLSIFSHLSQHECRTCFPFSRRLFLWSWTWMLSSESVQLQATLSFTIHVPEVTSSVRIQLLVGFWDAGGSQPKRLHLTKLSSREAVHASLLKRTGEIRKCAILLNKTMLDDAKPF